MKMTENDWNTTNQLAKLSFSNSAFPDQPSSNRSRLRRVLYTALLLQRRSTCVVLLTTGTMTIKDMGVGYRSLQQYLQAEEQCGGPQMSIFIDRYSASA